MFYSEQDQWEKVFLESCSIGHCMLSELIYGIDLIYFTIIKEYTTQVSMDRKLVK